MTTSTKIFGKYCDKALAVLSAQYDATKLVPHNATTGSVREQILRDFLSLHLPELVSVVSGQIFDFENNFSRQQDVVLVLKSMPRLPFANGTDLIYQEGVVATIEIKTSLSSAVISSIGENIASVRNLVSSSMTTSAMGVTHKWPFTRILTSIVTYGGASYGTIIDAIGSLEANKKPDVVLDLSGYLLIRNDGMLVKEQVGVGDYVLIQDAGDGFMFFLTFLTEITGTLSSRGVQWRNYWG
jgi:hypothetical protein